MFVLYLGGRKAPKDRYDLSLKSACLSQKSPRWVVLPLVGGQAQPIPKAHQGALSCDSGWGARGPRCGLFGKKKKVTFEKLLTSVTPLLDPLS